MENEIRAIIAEVMHKTHNIMRKSRYELEPLKWNDLPKIVTMEIDLQATAITKALLPYLDN